MSPRGNPQRRDIAAARDATMATRRRSSNRTVYRLAAHACRDLAPLLLQEGFHPAAVTRALECTRFVDALQPIHAFDWRRPILFFARLRRVAGITLGAYVFLAETSLLQRKALLAHEAVHVAQIETQGLLLFLIRYVTEWIGKRVRGMNDEDAYLALRDEVQARAVELKVAYAVAARKIDPSTPWLDPLDD